MDILSQPDVLFKMTTSFVFFTKLPKRVFSMTSILNSLYPHHVVSNASWPIITQGPLFSFYEMGPR